jgi:hypothetical protein
LKEAAAHRGFVGMNPSRLLSRAALPAAGVIALLAAFILSAESSKRGAPLLGLALLLGVTAPLAAARDFVSSYRPHRLQNGCLPETILFHDAYELRFPEEKVEIMLLELPDECGVLFGHALAVFTEKGRLYAWDFQMGRLPLDTDAPADRAALRASVTRAYQKASRTFVSSARASKTGRKACAMVAGYLSAERKPVRVSFTVDGGGRREGVAFMGFGLVWVYMPDTGTAFCHVTEPRPYDQLILQALKTRFAGEIRCAALTTGQPAAPKVF